MILDQIVQANVAELEARKSHMPLARLENLALEQSEPLDFAAALRGNDISIIAEIKKASPSRGIIRTDFDPVEIARTYVKNGAAAISVLTETRYFQGSLEYLMQIHQALRPQPVPLLRKDFIQDVYQIYESLAYGADCVLLIVAILQLKQLRSLLNLAHQLGMDCLVEVHDEKELNIALQADARIIGINNRDLRTFSVDIATTERLCPLIPEDRIIVSESGIKSRGDIERLKHAGISGVLVGEALMAAGDMAEKLRELL